MSALRKHPGASQLESAEECTRTLWKTYEFHMSVKHRDLDWHACGFKLFEDCLAAEARLWRLRETQANHSDRKDSAKVRDA